MSTTSSANEAHAPDLGSDAPLSTNPPSGENEAPQASSDQERVAVLAAEVTRLKDQALRAMAEAENTRRRAQREIEDNTRFALTNFSRDLLSVADNLRRALDSVTPEARQADDHLEKLCAGVELTERELASIFERAGIRRVDPLGQPFDHNFHQAVFQLESAEHAPGTVAQVLQAGYVLNGRLLRPAMVGVAKAKPTAAAPGEAQASAEAGTRLDTRA